MSDRRRLVLMRHAKAAPPDDASGDRARPLDAHGQKDAIRVAARLTDLAWVPDAVRCSDAIRTQETWEHIAGALSTRPLLTLVPALYGAGLAALRTDAQEWEPAWHTVLALGHNPGWEQAVIALCGTELTLKTGGCALLEGAGPTWSLALARPWRLVAFIRPKDLR